ncbi:MAG: fibronectin type III domain-containing protein, partial [Gemmatimonadetes bacterium]|nr:fibronectin type III domain-containing protein [Gemmatimonadota bacterium]
MNRNLRSGIGTDQRGFTLVESLISVVIVALLSFGLFRIFTTTNNTYNRGTENIDGQQNARAALNWIAKELRGAKGFNAIASDRVSFLSDANTTNQIRSFFLDTTDQDGDGDTSELLLVRSPLDDGTPGVAIDEIAVGVDSLGFVYRGSGGTVVASRAAVQEVEIVLFATGTGMREQAGGADHDARQVGMSTRVRCRNLGKSVPTGGDVTPPDPPTGLNATMACGTATLSWAANSETDLAGYYLYYSQGSSGSPYDGTDAMQGASPIFVGNSTSYTLTGLDMGQTYYFNLQALDSADNASGYATEVSGMPADASPPSTPANLTGRVVGNDEIQLSWSASGGWDVAQYVVQWHDDVDPSLVHSDSTSATSIVLSGLNENAIHTCSVSAIDGCGNQSPYSSEITITMVPCDQDVTFPEVPSDVVATPGDEFVRLSWTPVPDTDVVGYQVFFREAGGGGGSTLLVGNVSDYSVYGLDNGQEYEFQVAALDGCGHLGGYTALEPATPQYCGDNTTPPTTPINVTAWDIGLGDTIKISWAAASESDVLGYRVHYGTDSGNYTDVIDAGDVVFLTVGGLLAGDDYFFVVTAYDVCGNESSRSAEASATPTWGCACPPVVSTETPSNYDILEGTVPWTVSAAP